MLIELFKSKIHRATVTDANLNYEGSITIDSNLLKAAGIRVHEKVSVVDTNNGARFDTYVIEGKAGTGTICLNGAAARLVQPGDIVIIIAWCALTPAEADAHQPTVVKVDSSNRVVEVQK